ncbi:11236_t:CDS:2, partial [Scutellospora calospora]
MVIIHLQDVVVNIEFLIQTLYSLIRSKVDWFLDELVNEMTIQTGKN